MPEKRLTWRDRLDPFAADYAALVLRIEEQVRAMSDADLAELVAATRQPTQTNCAWSLYQVAPVVLDAVRAEQQWRKAVSRA